MLTAKSGVMGLAAAKSFPNGLLPLLPRAAVLVFDNELELQYAESDALHRAGYGMTRLPVSRLMATIADTGERPRSE